ncbi:MAG: polysaccharide biosynthesis C-terminal domain-containing protein, partial [Gemmatimonadetes bacterium]|nr:polysaccharide biosynthesis C-terminal domain-containing protein [Gemmatimonadota bacterium]
MSAPIRRLTGGPITPELLRLAWPVFVSHLLHTLYGLADMLWVGRVSADAIGAVSACFFASWSVMAIGDLFTAGVGALVSQAIGAGRDADAALVARTGLLASALTGAAIAAIGWFASPVLFRTLFEDPRIAEMSANYFRIYSLIAPGFYAAFVVEAVYRSCGDSRTPMLFTLVGVLLNLALDPLLILGAGPFPRLEVRGAALATVASHAVVVMLVAALAWRRRIPLLGSSPTSP